MHNGERRPAILSAIPSKLRMSTNPECSLNAHSPNRRHGLAALHHQNSPKENKRGNLSVWY